MKSGHPERYPSVPMSARLKHLILIVVELFVWRIVHGSVICGRLILHIAPLQAPSTLVGGAAIISLRPKL